jgi:hypothetical protein
MIGMPRWVLGVASFALGNVACELEHSCTDIGCESGVSVSVTSESGAWRAGEYQLQLTLDDETAACDFALPDDQPVAGSAASIECGHGVRLELRMLSGGEVGELYLGVRAQPKTLKVELSRDGAMVLDESQTLTYQRQQPNAGCEPICHRALAAFSAD